MDKILSLIKNEVCMGTYGLVELELRRLVKDKLISTNKPSTSINNLTCSDCCKTECGYRDVYDTACNHIERN